MRFPIRIDAIWRPFMLFIGATPSNSYVELEADELRMRFGLGFNQVIARNNVNAVNHMKWPLINGLGVRAGGTIFGLIGSTGGVVELELRDAVSLSFSGWPWVVSRIAISLEDPDGFIDSIRPSQAASTADPSDLPA